MFGLVAGLCVGIIPVVLGVTKEKLGFGSFYLAYCKKYNF